MPMLPNAFKDSFATINQIECKRRNQANPEMPIKSACSFHLLLKPCPKIRSIGYLMYQFSSRM